MYGIFDRLTELMRILLELDNHFTVVAIQQNKRKKPDAYHRYQRYRPDNFLADF
jgi:hypothetical protein